MNIALLGYGKMGKEIEAATQGTGISVVKIFRSSDNKGGNGLTPKSLSGVDVCIDFSVPAGVLDNIKAAAACGKDIIVGTTGWLDNLDDVQTIVRDNDIGLLYSSNFSIGVNIFMQMVENAVGIFNAYPDYDVALSETHHSKKADSPSGTALSLASLILQHFQMKTEVLSAVVEGAIKPHQLQVTSTRVGHVAGMHSVLFDSGFDSIELRHTAKNRRGFALGALNAAEWLSGRKGIYTMNDVLHKSSSPKGQI